MMVLSLSKVGYLSEAQVGGYPFDTVIQVVSHVFGLFHIHVLFQCIHE